MERKQVGIIVNMKDYFGRKLEIGDTIIWMKWDIKMFHKGKVVNFGKQFKKPYAAVNDWRNTRVQKGFIIIEKANGGKLEWIIGRT